MQTQELSEVRETLRSCEEGHTHTLARMSDLAKERDVVKREHAKEVQELRAAWDEQVYACECSCMPISALAFEYRATVCTRESACVSMFLCVYICVCNRERMHIHVHTCTPLTHACVTVSNWDAISLITIIICRCNRHTGIHSRTNIQEEVYIA